MIDTPMVITPSIDTPLIEDDGSDPQRPCSAVPGSTVTRLEMPVKRRSGQR